MVVAVVGAGAAGCVAARVLADRGFDVILLEAGPGQPRPSVLDELDHLRSTEASAWWWPGSPPRGRGLGGSTTVNGMVLQGVDPVDVRRWGWDDALDQQAAILERFETTTVSPGPFTSALEALVTRGVPVGRPTVESGAEGWSPLTIAARGDVRMSAADAFLAEAPSNLSIRTDRRVVGIDDRRLLLAPGEDLVVDHVVLAAGAVGSPALLLDAGLVDRARVDEPINHSSTSIVVELAPELRRRPDDVAPPSSRLLRLQTGLTENKVVDLQMIVLDHTGADEAGRKHGAVIVSALEPNRIKVLAEGITQALRWLGEVDGVLDISLSSDDAPIQHHCCSLVRALEPDRSLAGVPWLSVIDASALPALPHTNPMLSVMVGARRWAVDFSR
jgi:choline dehydrogenase-like flavoprotein